MEGKQTVINNYVRFTTKAPRAIVEHIECFNDYDQEGIDRALSSIQRHSKLKAVVWHKTGHFAHLPEVGEMSVKGSNGTAA